MSRCFPYPPPYYQQSLIDSIKEKEKAKLEKNKAKKENKEKQGSDVNENKRKKRRLDTEHLQLKEQKRIRKLEDQCLIQKTQVYSTKSSDDNELLEGSGVTEEYEPPCSIQQNSELSETSQDSKKTRQSAASVLSLNSNGTILRIKLPVSRKDHLEMPSLHTIGKKTSELKSSLFRESKSLSPPVEGKAKQSKVFPECNDVQIDGPTSRRKIELMPDTIVDQPQAKIARRIYSRPDYLTTSGLNNSVYDSPSVSVSGRQKDPVNCVRTPTPKLKFKVDSVSATNIPQSNFKLPDDRQRDLQPATGLKDLKSNSASPHLKQQCKFTTIVGGKKKDTDILDLRSKCEIKESLSTSELPCFSGRTTEAPHKHKSDKIKGSRVPDEEKFQELCVGWTPPPSLLLDSADVVDEDWLFGSSKRQFSTCVDKCEVNANLLPQVERYPTSLHTRASYMPELDMHILPYVIPF